MGTKRRPSKRNNYQKQEAISFLSNITLGNENERLSSDDSHELNDIRNIINYPEKRMKSEASNRSLSSSEITFYKLKGEDSQRLIASEKIKRKSDNSLNDNEQHNRAGIVSYFRYYRGILSKPKKKVNQHYSYVHERLINRHLKHRHVISYSHFLSNNTNTTTYNPYYLNMDDVSQISKQEINEAFQLLHPEIMSEMTFSKIKSVKLHLLNIAKVLDLELSSLSHAFVYFEKLLQKNIITKQNRKLIAACCLYLAVKINEPKGVCFKDLLETIHEEFDIGSKELKENEFAVFADLEFNLYVPVAEFMPHFDKLLVTIGHQSIEDYIGNETFYEINA